MHYSIWITVLFLAFSSSIDNFGVGITYGIRGIKVGLLANLIISIIAFIFSEAGIVSGQYISKVFPGTLSNVIGAFFLLVIGLRIVLLTFPRKDKQTIINNDDESVSNIVTNYLSSPEKADVDHSGDISSFEAIILGTAVSMNALTNGLGVGLIGLSPFAISIAASIFSFLAIWLGVLLGKKVANVKIGGWSLGQFSSIISGIILVLIAIHNLV
ncbi:sporulation membrane protein YtaF [Gottfriedia sp. NPDC057948]|jgi:putative sporulation protein YtaF|uniref:sporulation membrane protein YtaF n=1 Tax=Bacillaceae TaxID=186817 RepID=UPI000BFCBE17|nr:sporulation membrane protein YtaF [Bacillus sp. AFS053548]PGM56638.1 sporulation membrane protein YtaF [Bacillus sp. AFS053548]